MNFLHKILFGTKGENENTRLLQNLKKDTLDFLIKIIQNPFTNKFMLEKN